MNNKIQKDSKEAKKILAKASIEVTEDKIIASGNIESSNGDYLWALDLIVKHVLKDTDWEICHLSGDNRTNQIWATLKTKGESVEASLVEEEAELLQEKINKLMK